MSDAAVLARLKTRWIADIDALAPERPEIADALFADLMGRYGETQRHYHTAAHLDALFAKLDAHGAGTGEPLRLAFAGWYHDAIYDPQAKDNEEQSALLAIDALGRLGTDEGFIERVARLIRATASHTKGGADGDDNLFLDADFAILGSSPEAYSRYVGQVRREYAHVDEAGWVAGRGAFLKVASAAERTFLTDRFEQTYGARARANMADELASLHAKMSRGY